jgi:hypothetical protein
LGGVDNLLLNWFLANVLGLTNSPMLSQRVLGRVELFTNGALELLVPLNDEVLFLLVFAIEVAVVGLVVVANVEANLALEGLVPFAGGSLDHLLLW